MVSGKKESYDVSPTVNGGTEADINIWENENDKFIFGLTETYQESGVRVNLFNARARDGIKKIQIWQSEKGQVGAAMVLTTSPDPVPMRSIGDRQYREGDRINKKDLYGWGVTAGTGCIQSGIQASGGAQ